MVEVDKASPWAVIQYGRPISSVTSPWANTILGQLKMQREIQIKILKFQDLNICPSTVHLDANTNPNGITIALLQ